MELTKELIENIYIKGFNTGFELGSGRGIVSQNAAESKLNEEVEALVRKFKLG